jgi:hypothetical protein
MAPWAPLGGPNPAPPAHFLAKTPARQPSRPDEGGGQRGKRHAEGGTRILRLDDERIIVAMSQWAARRCTFTKSSVC